ncbi:MULTISPECIES: NADPH-dependent FMN reductase [unclassified Streptomyces]|uniref:NADPH-dependent FMN reductase n=1 Tax=unclassified Streptomyces TaxID=2593676 RepID=UPI00278C662F|nr:MULTISPECIES: NAD(P)H-dependent oxidoreductase [unclassified Streptomyces]
MSGEPIRVAVITGSTRDGRFGPTVADWFADQARQHGGVAVEAIDLADYPLPTVLPDIAVGAEPPAATQKVLDALAARLSAADAFAVVTPEYNHSVPASLKNVIDWYLDEWKAKPVGLISYGGMGGGLRASEHLRQIFAEVHAVTVRDMISFHNAWNAFEQGGKRVCPEGSDAAAKGLLDQLVWFGRALRDAREKVPYQG